MPKGCADRTCLSDNIDYDELKVLIKVHMTRDQVPIPGQEDTSLAKFEEVFFNEICNPYDRVDLFVSSKVDEISRQLSKSSAITIVGQCSCRLRFYPKSRPSISGSICVRQCEAIIPEVGEYREIR
jgi:hypothetical protein